MMAQNGATTGKTRLSTRRAEMARYRLRLTIFMVMALVLAVIFGRSAYEHRQVEARFTAAHMCAGTETPLGDCVGWESETISSVQISKNGSTHIGLDNGAMSLSFTHEPHWIAALTAGESVSTMVWEGGAQAIRDPIGQVDYGEGAGPNNGIDQIAYALAASAVFLILLAVTSLMELVGTWRVSFARRLRFGLSWIVLDIGFGTGTASIETQDTNSIGVGIQDAITTFEIAVAITAIALALGFYAIARRRRPAPNAGAKAEAKAKTEAKVRGK